MAMEKGSAEITTVLFLLIGEEEKGERNKNLFLILLWEDKL